MQIDESTSSLLQLVKLGELKNLRFFVRYILECFYWSHFIWIINCRLSGETKSAIRRLIARVNILIYNSAY